MTDIVNIKGKTHDNAVLLLDAAGDSPLLVQTTTDGFRVPREIAIKAGLLKDDEKDTSRRTAARKTATKKAAPATDDKKE